MQNARRHLNGLFFLLLSFSMSLEGICQIPSNPIGNNRLSLKWSQIETDFIKIVFPKSLDQRAQRIARIIHAINENSDTTDKPFKTTLILNAESVVSNGLVTVGPFRSEFFPVQRQFMNSTDYLDLLTIHEYRHIQQFSTMTKGITKTVKNILGSWAWGGMMATAVPRWYFEGDAVIEETNNTRSGRGGLPSFEMQYYALFSDDKDYNYEKAGAGSINDYVPDWYPLGYQMLNYVNDRYEEDLWSKVVDDAVRYKGLFYPFNKSLKRHTGLSATDLYNNAYDFYKSDYKNYIANLDLSPSLTLTHPNSNTVTNYYLPKIHDKALLCVKSSYDRLPHVMIKRGEKEYPIVEIGRQLDGVFTTLSLSNSKLAWAQVAFDSRWRYRQYNDIYIYDLVKNAKKRLTKGAKYFAPALSNDASKIAAIFINDELLAELHVLSELDGRLIKNYNISEFSQIAHPFWLNDEKIGLIASKDQHSYVITVNLENGEIETITPGSPHQISHPTYKDGFVYFSSSYSRISNIYRVNIMNKNIQKLTETSIGAFHPDIDESGNILYSELSSKGYRIKKLENKNLVLSELNINEDGRNKLQNSERSNYQLLENLRDTTFTIRKFNKMSGILNFHSLLPQIEPPVSSLRLLSDNAFSTMSAELGASYNHNENEWSYFVGLNYAELFPVINASYVHNHRNGQFFNFSTASDTSTYFTDYVQDWSEDRFTLGLSVPINLSAGNMNSGINLFSRFQIAKLNVESSFDSEEIQRIEIPNSSLIDDLMFEPLASSDIKTLDYGASLFAVRRQAQRQLNPSFGIALSFRVRNQLSNNLVGGNVSNYNATLFLPGVLKTHSFYTTLAIQKENALDTYRYSDLYNYPRGYDFTLRRDNYFKWGVNYAFPLFYPDAAVGGMMFLKRIKSNIFFDYGYVNFSKPPFNNEKLYQRSVGVELGFDFRAFRLVEVDMGIRFSRLLDNELFGDLSPNQFEFFVTSITE